MPNVSTPLQFQRLYSGALDITNVHDSYDEAVAYATSPTAYGGQIIGIKSDDGNSYDVYVINEDRSLKKVESVSGGSGLPEDSTKLDKNFLDGNTLVQDIKIEEDVPKKSFRIRKILADPNNPATSAWLEHDTTIQSSDGIIQISISGTEDNKIIDLTIPEIDGGLF